MSALCRAVGALVRARVRSRRRRRVWVACVWTDTRSCRSRRRAPHPPRGCRLLRACGHVWMGMQLARTWGDHTTRNK